MDDKEINFRIVIVPIEKYRTDEEIKQRLTSYLIKLTLKLESCGLKNILTNFLKVKKSEEEDYPEIDELVLQVQAQCFPGIKSFPRYCKEFCSDWKNLFNPNSSPILVFYENKCFIKNRQPTHINVSYKSIAFGILPYDGQYHQYVSLNEINYAHFYHDIRSVTITFRNFEITFPYSNIKNVFVNIDSNPVEVFFDLCNPPLIFRVETKRNSFETYELKHRSLLLNDISELIYSKHKPVVKVNVLGKANVLRLSFNNVQVVDEIISRIHFRSSEKPIHYASITSKPENVPIIPHFDWAHFGCTYLMNAILKRNFLLPAQTTDINNALSNLRYLSNTDGDCLEKALTLVLSALETGKVINYWHAIERQYFYYCNNKNEIDYMHYVVPKKCHMIRRITLTPTRQLLWPPEIMFGNRILRNFDSEYAVRVSFRDDNNSKLSLIASYADRGFFEFSILKPMVSGICIGSRNYEFLAWSNSQIREHGIWMYASDAKGNTAQSIRKWMGDFSHIHSVPKYMARMGQAFSQTEDAISVPLDPRHIRTERDIEGGIDYANGGKPYCFSDGVGRISSKLSNEVRTALGHDKLCSAFQIRYGGFKGMLVVDPRLNNADIVFRESMKKFDSPKNQRLEIAKTSAPSALQLNRPFITILNDLGVRYRTFLKLQEDMLRDLTDMLFEEEKAIDFLKSKTPSNMFKYEDLSKSGIYLTTEPFFRSLLLALHRHRVENIKKRANIAVDPQKGRNMLGVLDETGSLKYGEVFVQYTKDISCGETTRDTKILKGLVMVTKNPCSLPGDVRKFTAVDIPGLRHIVDCIVFPQKGPRPHPNEMAGSDLDGDEYAVLWDKDLIFEADNHPPGRFPSASIPDKYSITVSDMIECLINYIKNDQVGVIANAHLAHADSKGIFSKICKNIAEKFSFAVDFAKTGVSRNLDREERPAYFPDFMEKNNKETYKSKKTLGRMYRVVKDYEEENESASLSYHEIRLDKDLLYPGWKKYEQEAIKSRNKYSTLLRTVLRNYGIQHEAEVFSGAFTNLHCRFQERKDKVEIEKIVVRCIKRLSECMKEEFLEEFKESCNIKEIHVTMLQKASAWYAVTYCDSNAKILSFPWTVSEYLSNIKIRKVLKLSPYSPIVLKMDEHIKLCEMKRQLPNFTETHEWNNYNFLCGDPSIVRLALRVLLFWAEEEEIIERPCRHVPGLMLQNAFIRLFFYVAEISSYISRKPEKIEVPKNKLYSPASLCLEFWRFCLRLRFYNEYEVVGLLSFPLDNYKVLSNRAVVTFHRFAVLGEFQNLSFDSKVKGTITDMKPIYIESKIFLRTPIDKATLTKAEDALSKYSKAEYVGLREIRQTKKVLVSATGTEQSLKTLKSILRKKHVFLRELFSTGIMPVST